MSLIVNKKFDKELHGKYDNVGREIVKNYFQKRTKFTAKDNPNEYGVDLLLFKENVLVGYAEVEVRKNWNTDKFPFDTLNVPLRKKKLLENDLPTYFFSVNYTHTKMFCCEAETVLNSKIQENKNKYVNSNEYFYKVPVSELKLITL